MRFGSSVTETYDQDGFFASAGSGTASSVNDLIALLPAGYVYYITELDTPEGFLSQSGRVAEFTYSSLEWNSRATAEREISIPYSHAQAVEEEFVTRLTEPEDNSEEPAAAHAGTALPLLLLLTALGLATTALVLKQRRDARCVTA